MKTLPLLLALSAAIILSSCSTDRTSASFTNAKRSFQQQNYEAAYQQILVPAEKGNPEAQYALGYMYYYGKGAPMNHVLGRNWIRKAAVAGDENAIKALQMILAQQQNITAVTPTSTQPSVTQAAALPSTDMTSNVKTVAKPLPLPHHQAAVAAVPVVHHKSTTRYTTDEQQLLRASSGRYALQLLDAGQLHYAKSFVKRYGLGSKAKVYHRLLNGKYVYVIVYGDYIARANAQTALTKLPKPVQKLKPWIRRNSGIQTEIRNN